MNFLNKADYRLRLSALGSLIGLTLAVLLIVVWGPDKGAVEPAKSTILLSEASLAMPTLEDGISDRPMPGQLAPAFTLSTLTDETIGLSDFRGRPVLINFWATWCGPCREEMPALVEAYGTYQADGFMVLAVNMTALDSVENVQAFVDEYNIPFPILLDQDNHVTDELYRVMGVPMSFFITRDGRVNDRHVGAMSREQIAAYIQKIL